MSTVFPCVHYLLIIWTVCFVYFRRSGTQGGPCPHPSRHYQLCSSPGYNIPSCLLHGQVSSQNKCYIYSVSGAIVERSIWIIMAQKVTIATWKKKIFIVVGLSIIVWGWISNKSCWNIKILSILNYDMTWLITGNICTLVIKSNADFDLLGESIPF